MTIKLNPVHKLMHIGGRGIFIKSYSALEILHNRRTSGGVIAMGVCCVKCETSGLTGGSPVFMSARTLWEIIEQNMRWKHDGDCNNRGSTLTRGYMMHFRRWVGRGGWFLRIPNAAGGDDRRAWLAHLRRAPEVGSGQRAKTFWETQIHDRTFDAVKGLI
jgi:hypothetical protein